MAPKAQETASPTTANSIDVIVASRSAPTNSAKTHSNSASLPKLGCPQERQGRWQMIRSSRQAD